MSNLKHIDFVYQTHSGGVNTLKVSRETTPNSLIANASTYATHLKPYTMRNQAVNFQTEISKACSDWVVYYSSVTEVWGFFLFFYFIALFFFFISLSQNQYHTTVLIQILQHLLVEYLVLFHAEFLFF